MWTQQDEARLQELQHSLGAGPQQVPAENPEGYGILGFSGRTAANILPGALEKLINIPEGILNMGVPEDYQSQLTTVPNFFDVRAPQSISEHIIGGAGEIAEYLPSIIATEGAAASGLARLGMAVPRTAEAIAAGARLAPTRAARIAASGIGQGLPMTPHGAETTMEQGGVGALQTAAMDWGWRGKAAASLIGGGIGYYQGAHGPDGTPLQGAIYGGLNALGPIAIDPLVNKLTGYKPGAKPGGDPIPGQPATPYGPAERPDILQTGRTGLPFGVDEAMADAQRTTGAGAPYDVFGGRVEPWSGLRRSTDQGPLQPGPNGLPFYEAPDTSGMSLRQDPAQTAAAAEMAAPSARVRRTDYPQANLMQRQLFPIQGEVGMGNLFGGLDPRIENIAQSPYGNATSPYDIFAGLQTEFLSPAERAHFRDGPPAKTRTQETLRLPDPNSTPSASGLRLTDRPAPEPGIPFLSDTTPSGMKLWTDPLSPNERATQRGQVQVWNNPDQSAPYVQGVSPHPGLNFGLMGTGSEFAYGRGTDPFDIFGARGVQPAPIMSQGETFAKGGLFPQAPLSPGEQVAISGHRAGRDVPVPQMPERKPTPVTSTPAGKGKIAALQNVFTPQGKPFKAKPTGKPRIVASAVRDNATGKIVTGAVWNDMHKSVKEQNKMAHLFDVGDDAQEATHGFIVEDEAGNIRPEFDRDAAGVIADAARQRDTEYGGYRLQSEHLRNPTKPVEPAPAAAGPAPHIAELEALKEAASLANTKHQNMWGAKADYPYKQRRKVRDEAYALNDKVDAMWEKHYGSRLTGRNEAGQTFSEWMTGITPEYKAMMKKIEAEEAARAAAPSLQKLEDAEIALNYMADKLFKMQHGKIKGATAKGIADHIAEVARLQKVYNDLREARYGKRDNVAPKAADVAPEPAPAAAGSMPVAGLQTPSGIAAHVSSIPMYRGVRGAHKGAGIKGPQYFISSESFAKTYGPTEAHTLNLKNPKIVSDAEWPAYSSNAFNPASEIAQKLIAEGHDSVVNIRKTTAGDMITTMVVDAEQALKSKVEPVVAPVKTNKAPTKADVAPEPALIKPDAVPEDGRPKVMVPSKLEGAWVEATVIGKDRDVLTVKVNDIHDPIYGDRTMDIAEKETRPFAALQKAAEGGGTVPFKDVESSPLTRKDAVKGENYGGAGDETMLGSVIESSGPAKTHKTLKGKAGTQKWVLGIKEALDLLPAEPRAILAEILHQVNVAVGRDMPIHFERDMQGAKGGSYTLSGRIGVNLHWLNQVVQDWEKMSPAKQADALMQATALLGHEVTHTVQRFAEQSGMAINGVPITDVIVASVNGMSLSSRKYVAEQILKAKGQKNASQRVIDYLSGDSAMIKKWYEQKRGPLSQAQVERLAAGEVMAEVGSIELVKRMKFDGLPQTFREAVDRFKQVLVNVTKWITGTSKDHDIAALQNLQSIASKMYDHFGAADEHGLAKAFQHSTQWKEAPTVNPFSSAAPKPPGTPGSTVTVPPDVEVLNGALLRHEILRLGVRGAVGGTIGAFAGPAIAPNQITTAEGILLGGIAGVFGVTVAKKLMSGNLAVEAAAALKAHPKNPLKALGHILGGGKSLQELGIEGRHGWNGIGSSMAKWVRQFEKDFDLNLDPKQKALFEDARGAGAEQIAIMTDAFDKTRWFKPNASMIEAVGHYLEGRISKDDYMRLLTTPEQQQYGNFIVTAREAMTNLSNMFADGLPNGAFKKHVMETSETYLGKFYTAYTDGKFKMEHFDAAKKDMMAKLNYSDQTADALMHEYMREVHANRKMFSTGRRGESGEKYDTSTLMRRMATEEEIQGQSMVVAGLEHDKHGTDYIREKAKLDWMEEHKITDNWRRWLGEVENPLQRMVYTIQKIHASAISGKAFDLLDTMTHTNGNKFSYTSKDILQARALLESEIAKATPDKIAGLQIRLRDLNGYGPLPQGAAYGKLSGKWVDRFTRDGINTYDSPYKWLEQPIIRSMAEFNNLIKIGHTAYNPLTVMRNYMQAPIMGLIARTTAGDVGSAWKEIHYTKGEDYRLMLRKHVIGSDFSTQELSKGPGTIFSGHMDADIAVKAGKEIHRAVLKGYQQPDMIIRAGAFISARKRFAQQALEKGIEVMDDQGVKSAQHFADLQEAMKHEGVINQAVEFTNRYTMNYATVPAIVKAGRQLPFINLYISYTSEITRILKNLTEDMIAPGPNSAGRMHAITTLAAMAAIPTIMTMGGRSMLSDRDRKDWDQVEALSPGYNRSRFRIPYKREADGRFRYFDITNLLPADNFSQMTKALVQGDNAAFWSANPLVSMQNTPLLNMATEQITGKDMRTEQSIEGFGRVREILKEVLPPILPPGYEGQRLQRAFSTNVEGTAGLTNMRTGVQYRPSDIVANYLTGMRFGNVMLSTMQKGAISEAKQQIAEQQQLMRETTNMNAGPAAAQHATEIYNKAVEQIMLQLHSKMPSTQ